jgi:hypothetical protein
VESFPIEIEDGDLRMLSGMTVERNAEGKCEFTFKEYGFSMCAARTILRRSGYKVLRVCDVGRDGIMLETDLPWEMLLNWGWPIR